MNPNQIRDLKHFALFILDNKDYFLQAFSARDSKKSISPLLDAVYNIFESGELVAQFQYALNQNDFNKLFALMLPAQGAEIRGKKFLNVYHCLVAKNKKAYSKHFINLGNPEGLSFEDRIRLNLLISQYGASRLNKNSFFFLERQGGRVEAIALSHMIIKNEEVYDDEHEREVNYYVMEKKSASNKDYDPVIASGASGRVKRSKRYFTANTIGTVDFTEKAMVAKINEFDFDVAFNRDSAYRKHAHAWREKLSKEGAIQQFSFAEHGKLSKETPAFSTHISRKQHGKWTAKGWLFAEDLSGTGISGATGAYKPEYQNLAPEDKIALVIQLLEQIVALHEENFIHRDIKPNNLFLDTKALDLTLIDFDLSEPCSETMKGDAGSRHFYAPETVTERIQSKASDMYAAAGTIAHLLGAIDIGYHKKRRGEKANYCWDGISDFFGDGYVHEELISHLKKMSTTDYKERPTAQESLGFFKQMYNKAADINVDIKLKSPATITFERLLKLKAEVDDSKLDKQGVWLFIFPTTPKGVKELRKILKDLSPKSYTTEALNNDPSARSEIEELSRRVFTALNESCNRATHKRRSAEVDELYKENRLTFGKFFNLPSCAKQELKPSGPLDNDPMADDLRTPMRGGGK